MDNRDHLAVIIWREKRLANRYGHTYTRIDIFLSLHLNKESVAR